MTVRNNRSELAIANRHQERYNFTEERFKTTLLIKQPRKIMKIKKTFVASFT